MENKDLTIKKLQYLSGLNELDSRHYVALWAMELGWGGISEVSRLTGKAMDTIRKGICEIKAETPLKEGERIRRIGGGRKKIVQKDPGIKREIESILEENTAGDPMSMLKWTNKSTYAIAAELSVRAMKISPDTVGRIIRDSDYTLQSNSKSKEDGNSENRDSQFRYINLMAKEFAKNGDPIISVDAKKKELVGNFKNHGRRWIKKGKADIVNVYDFSYLAKGKAAPYGIYDLETNSGFVNVGISHDTAEFAVESIRQWWKRIGHENYPDTKELLITADCGGSNSSRSRLWKYQLQEFSNESCLKITVCHYPPGTSKWNKIEHKMFSFISMNWRGKPLVNYKTIVNLIQGTTTRKGLKISARVDRKVYEIGRKIPENEFRKINITNHKTNPQWNYTISKI